MAAAAAAVAIERVYDGPDGPQILIDLSKENSDAELSHRGTRADSVRNHHQNDMSILKSRRWCS